MIDLFFTLLEPIFELFAVTYEADSRPEARQLATGCFGIVAGMIMLSVLFFGLLRMLG